MFQLAISPFNCIDKVMEKVGEVLSKENSRDINMKDTGEETTIERLMKKYPWWMPTSHVERAIVPYEKTEDTVSLFKDKNTRV
jgi:hypothetical protein